MLSLILCLALIGNAHAAPYLVLPDSRSSLGSSVSSATGTSSSSTMAKTLSSASSATLQQMRRTMLELLNQERKKKKLPLLKQNAILDLSAQGHAEDMAKRKFFEHKNPDGRTPEDRIRAAGYFTPPCLCSYRFAYGENIAKGQKTVAEVMRAWMNSKVHRANILRPDFLELGVGFVNGLWVQNFGGVHVGQ